MLSVSEYYATGGICVFIPNARTIICCVWMVCVCVRACMCGVCVCMCVLDKLITLYLPAYHIDDIV